MTVPLLRSWYLWRARRAHPAAKQGERVGMYSLARMLHRAGRTAEAEPWYQRAAAAGDPAAAWNLARLLERTGRHAQALPYYRQAAEAGDVKAMLDLAVALNQQHHDPIEAQAWYQRAADAEGWRLQRALWWSWSL